MYQKIAAALAAAVLCMPAYAAQTKNTMKMVSYFPVPYVAYDTVSANNAMDIGVLNQCVMDIKKGSSNLGGSACSLYLYGNANGADLNRGLLNVTAGKLDLNSTVNNARIVSKKVQIGEDMTTQGGWLDIGIPSGKNDSYDALYLGSIANTGNSFRVTSKEDGATVNSFHMFNEISNDFPGCAGTVTWQELELGADVDTNTTYTDVYLVCNGTGDVTPPQECQAPNGQTYTESCPSGQTGTITYTWQGEPTCSYKKTDNCQEEECQPTNGQSYTEECPDGQTGTITYTWNQSTCSYKETNDCIDAGCGPEPARPAETRKVCDSCGYTNFLGYVCNTDTRQWEEDWSSCVAGDVVRSGDYRVIYSNRAECCPFVDPIEEADNWDIITRESGISPKACWLGELSQRASNYNASYWGNLPNCPQLEGRRYSWCYNVGGGSSPVVEYVEQNRDCAASVGVNQACLFTETKDVGCGDYEVWQCKVSKNW